MADSIAQAAAAHAASVMARVWQFVLTLILTLTLLQRSAIAAPTAIGGDQGKLLELLPLLDRWQRPGMMRVHEERGVSDDLSAAVRIHKAGAGSVDVWLITPLSRHWNAVVADAPELSAQLKRARWQRSDSDSDALPEAHQPAVRFQRISTLRQQLPQLPARTGGLMKLRQRMGR